MLRLRAAALVSMLVVLGCSTPTADTAAQSAPATAASATASTTVLGAPGAPAGPKLGPDTRDYDGENLVLDLDLDMERGSLMGTATHTMTALADLSTVRMHLLDMTVSSVTTGEGATCTSSLAGGVLSIGLDRPRKKGERFSLKIAYGGTPKSGLWFFKPTPEYPDVPLQVYTQGEGTENRHWIPCYDLPDDRLTSSMRVIVPLGLQTLSNGRPAGTEALADGRVAHTWVLERPHVSYLISLVVGTFDDVKRDAAGVEQHDLVPPGWGPWCDEVFGRTPDMMRFFQDYTGQPYPWGRYSQVTVWDFMWGGMENTGATTLNMRALHKDGVRPDYSADGLVAHELAHQWFGDLITCRTMNHMWLNEGFATYLTDLWHEHHAGPEQFAADCLDRRESYMDSVNLKEVSEKPRPAKATDCGDIEAHPYMKGASVLHMLRKLIGDDVFKRGIQRYVRDNRDKSVESEALRAAMEAESKQDLKWFFDQWVYGSGYPELTVAATVWGRGVITVLIDQTQPVTKTMPAFRLPVDVEIRWPNSKNVIRKHIEITETSHGFTFNDVLPADGSKGSIEDAIVIFDPDHVLLARIRELRPRTNWEWQVLYDPSNVGRMLAARALADFGFMAGDAIELASQDDARFEVRAAACTALGKMHTEETAAHLREVVGDKDSRVRRAVANAMGECEAQYVATELKKYLADDPSVYVAADAAAALGKTKAPGAFEALVDGLKRESHRDQIRQRIMDGLKDLGDKRGAEIAMRYLGYEWGHGIQHQLRKAALDAMVTLAPDAPETKAWVLKLLRDPYFRMKQWAADAAVKLKIVEALPILDDLAVNATGPGVTKAMKAAAAKLRAPAEIEE